MMASASPAKSIALGALGVMGAMYVISELRYQRQLSAPFWNALSDIGSNEPHRVEAGLNALMKLMDDDKGGVNGTKYQVIDSGLTPVVKLFSKDCLAKHSKHILSLAMKVVQKCSDEAQCKANVAYLGLVEALLRLFAEMSHVRKDTAADNKFMEDIAATLASITAFDHKKIVVRSDVPAGSECALRLIRSRNLGSVLEMLAFDVRTTNYLQTLAKVFANISFLEEGAQKLYAAGALGHALPLLSRPMMEVKEHAMTVIRNLVKKETKARDEFHAMQPEEKLSMFFTPQYQKNAKMMENLMHIVGDLLMRGTHDQVVQFGMRLVQSGVIDQLCAMMAKDLPRQTRGFVEEVITIAINIPELEEDVKAALTGHGAGIQKRKRQDQEDMRSRVQQQDQQQRFMEMMAMQQMMGGGDMGMDELAAMQQMMGGGGMM